MEDSSARSAEPSHGVIAMRSGDLLAWLSVGKNRGHFPKKKPKLPSGKIERHPIPEGLWLRCPDCSALHFKKALDENLKVCLQCQRHFYMGARERIHSLVETCSFEEHDSDMLATDILKFVGCDAVFTKTGKNIGGAFASMTRSLQASEKSANLASRSASWILVLLADLWVPSLARNSAASSRKLLINRCPSFSLLPAYLRPHAGKDFSA